MALDNCWGSFFGETFFSLQYFLFDVTLSDEFLLFDSLSYSDLLSETFYEEKDKASCKLSGHFVVDLDSNRFRGTTTRASSLH